MTNGVSPSRISPVIAYTAGTLLQALQFSSNRGVICVVSGKLETGGSDGWCALQGINEPAPPRGKR